MRRLLLLCLTSLFAAPVFAADPCPLLRAQAASTDTATRIAAIACKENQDWFRPFIDENGRSGGLVTYEAENSLLADGSEAWRKVAGYWNGSGVLASVGNRAGAGECAYAATMPYPSPACRSFIIDTPWSAAFVSWVMAQAGLPGFRRSASHVDYVRQAYRDPAQSPYRIQAPQSGKPAPGDLLCYVRAASRIFGYGDLATLLSLPDSYGLAMHCDIVVAATPGGLAYLVGGNVQQTVTLRMLKLDARGYFAELPARTLADPECSPDAPANCNGNRQDWAVMLKLRPPAELAQLAPPPPVAAPGQPAAPSRCVEVAGGMQVCSSSSSAPATDPQPQTTPQPQP
ncbi:MAG: DUF2272 domain-containing protein [Pseudoxanthomonas sp.]